METGRAKHDYGVITFKRWRFQVLSPNEYRIFVFVLSTPDRVADESTAGM